MKKESKNIRINKMFKTKINIDNSSHGKMGKYSFVKKLLFYEFIPEVIE